MGERQGGEWGCGAWIRPACFEVQRRHCASFLLQSECRWKSYGSPFPHLWYSRRFKAGNEGQQMWKQRRSLQRQQSAAHIWEIAGFETQLRRLKPFRGKGEAGKQPQLSCQGFPATNERNDSCLSRVFHRSTTLGTAPGNLVALQPCLRRKSGCACHGPKANEGQDDPLVDIGKRREIRSQTVREKPSGGERVEQSRQTC